MTRSNSENSVTTRSYWNSVWSAAPASTVLEPGDFYAGRNGLFIKLVRRRVGLEPGQTVIELGGGGNNVRLLALAKWLEADTTALDYSEEGLRSLSELFSANGCRARLLCADLRTWAPEERFDVVTHWGVLEHFVDPRPLLEKSAAALRPGGTLVFSMPNMESPAARLWARWSPDNWAMHVWHSQETILKVLSEIGFRGASAFHFGIPFVKMMPWERRSPAQLPFDLLQKVASASARILPIFDRYGHRAWSMERGFCARWPG